MIFTCHLHFAFHSISYLITLELIWNMLSRSSRLHSIVHISFVPYQIENIVLQQLIYLRSSYFHYHLSFVLIRIVGVLESSLFCLQYVYWNPIFVTRLSILLVYGVSYSIGALIDTNTRAIASINSNSLRRCKSSKDKCKYDGRRR